MRKETLIAQAQKSPQVASEGLTRNQKELFMQHLGVVNFVVRKLMTAGPQRETAIERSDLIQFGLLGLLEAVERFDPARGVQFTTYAVSRIRGMIQDELRKLDWKPRSIRKRDREKDAMIQQVKTTGESGETSEDIAQRLSMTLEEYLQVLERAESDNAADIESLNLDHPTLISMIATAEQDPSEIMQKDQIRDLMFSAIDTMEERERIVLILYYYEELTFKEIARILRISESRVFQIHSTVMRELRNRIEQQGGSIIQ